MRAFLALASVLGVGFAPGQSETRPGASSESSLEKRVDAAVDRGVRWLLAQQKPDGGFGALPYHERTFVAGQTAIALYALLASGANRYDPEIEKGYRHLEAHPPGHTYEVALTLLALDAKAAPVGERLAFERMTPAERCAYRFPRALSPAEKERVRECAEWLVRHRFHGLWQYDPEPTGADVSNSQFALLGLKAAVRCGERVPPEVWGEAFEYFLRNQQPRGPTVSLPMPRGRANEPEFSRIPAEARGWGYAYGETGDKAVTGSRTAIGVASLLLCKEELWKPDAGREGGHARAKATKLDEALRDGLAWLHSNFAVDRNPNDEVWLHYYLYALERVGALTESATIGDHDWYREGAEFLVRAQRKDGSWEPTGYSGELPNTCFALLFLRRSTLPPVPTGN